MSADQFFKGFREGLFNDMQTCALARIEKVDLKTMKVDVVTHPDEDLILDVPISAPQTQDFIIRVPYKPGDIGVVVFSKSEIDSVMQGGVDEVSERVMEVDDAIFIGGVNLFTNEMPDGHDDDLIIAKKDQSAKIVITESGEIQFSSETKILLDSPIIELTGETITANGEDLTTDLV